MHSKYIVMWSGTWTFQQIIGWSRRLTLSLFSINDKAFVIVVRESKRTNMTVKQGTKGKYINWQNTLFVSVIIKQQDCNIEEVKSSKKTMFSKVFWVTRKAYFSYLNLEAKERYIKIEKLKAIWKFEMINKACIGAWKDFNSLNITFQTLCGSHKKDIDSI